MTLRLKNRQLCGSAACKAAACCQHQQRHRFIMSFQHLTQPVASCRHPEAERRAGGAGARVGDLLHRRCVLRLAAALLHAHQQVLFPLVSSCTCLVSTPEPQLASSIIATGHMVKGVAGLLHCTMELAEACVLRSSGTLPASSCTCSSPAWPPPYLRPALAASPRRSRSWKVRTSAV